MPTLRRLLSVALLLSATACTASATSTSAHRDPSGIGGFGGFGPAAGSGAEIGSAASQAEPFHVEPVHVAHGEIHESSAMRFSSQCSHCP